MAASVDIVFKKIHKTYSEGDDVSGLVIVDTKTEMKHDGVVLFLDGVVNLQPSSKAHGIFEAFYNSIKPISLLNYSIEAAKPGKFPAGRTEIPFEFSLKSRTNKVLYETYHGVCINVSYTVRCEIRRKLLAKDLHKTVEFIVERKSGEYGRNTALCNFNLSPESLKSSKGRIPSFNVKGRLDSTVCNITKPFTGEFTVEHCETCVKSIELQLVRVETTGCAEGFAKEATEIQNIQLAEGNVCRNLTIPIYMVFPRLFTCPTIQTNNFKIEFEVNLVIIFQDEHVVTENFPIRILRI